MPPSRRPAAAPRRPNRSDATRSPGATRRPATARRSTRPPAAGVGRRTVRRRPVSPVRIAVIAAILVMLSVTLVPTLRSFLHQRAEISSMQEQIARQHQTVDGLQQERKRWQDPAYVEQQARERLKFVMPGEKSYTVIDDTGSKPASSGEPGVAEVTQKVQSKRPWYGQLWESMKIADSGK